jgi:hypothetical protein
MKKIYIGPANLANIFYHLEKSLSSCGIKADFITWSNTIHPFDYEKAKVFRLVNKPPFRIFNKNIFYFLNNYILKPIYFLYALIKYDVFLFIKPSTFFRNNNDLKILKFFNKSIGIFQVGCTDRNLTFDSDPEYVCNMCTDMVLQINCFCDNPNKKMAQSFFFEKYADYIFGPPDTVSYTKNKNKVHQYAVGRPEIIIKAINKNFYGRLKISHLPSNPLVKGTQIIIPVLNRISKEEDINIVIKNEIWSRERIIKEIKDSHILIDSLLGYIFGTISLEAIQYGCVALSAYPKWISDCYDIPPVVKITGDSLYTILKEIINDRQLLKHYAERSQESYNRYFTYEAAGKYYKQVLQL